jgi:hypothetical protein
MYKKDNISPLIHKNSSENPFTTPNGYFEDFEKRLAEKIAKQAAPAVEVKHLSMPIRAAIMAAASVAIIVAIGVTFYVHGKKQPITQTEMLVAYEASLAQEVNDAELINKLVNMQNDEVRKDSALIEKDEYSGHLINYLSNEDPMINYESISL